MAKLDKPVFKDKVEIQDNVYIAKILSIDLKDWGDKHDSETGELVSNKSFNWKFELMQPPFIGKKVWVWGTTYTSPTPKAAITTWAAALGYTREQLIDPSFDTDVFVGAYVKVSVKTWKKKDGILKQGVKDINPLTELDNRMLQEWLKESNQGGPVKVAVEAQFVAPSPQSVEPRAVSHQPVVATHASPVIPKKVTGFPF